MVVVVAFSWLARIWGDCSTIHSPPAFFFFFKVEISSRTLIPLFRPRSVHGGSASWDDCDRVFPDDLRVSAFPDRSHTMPGRRHSQPALTLSACHYSNQETPLFTFLPHAHGLAGLIWSWHTPLSPSQVKHTKKKQKKTQKVLRVSRNKQLPTPTCKKINSSLQPPQQWGRPDFNKKFEGVKVTGSLTTDTSWDTTGSVDSLPRIQS